MKKTVIFTVGAILKGERAKELIKGYQAQGIPFALLTYVNANNKEKIMEMMQKLGLMTDTIFVRKTNDNRSIVRYALDIIEASKNYEIVAVYIDKDNDIDRIIGKKLSEKGLKVYYL